MSFFVCSVSAANCENQYRPISEGDFNRSLHQVKCLMMGKSGRRTTYDSEERIDCRQESCHRKVLEGAR
ncbi:MAG: hypothetical protein QOJ51_1283 [Acidobacteriaceae bacterium]|jgi:hypothetical protein|nr:hypothetical protein [Acidobacteriaceae bacterium]